MLSLKELSQNRLFEIVKKPTSERAELLRIFIDRVKNKKGQSYSPGFMGMKLSHVTTSDLYFLQKKCEEAKNFGAMFWYLIGPKRG